MDDTSRSRWYRLTPDRLILVLLIVECLFWLSQRFQWFAFNQDKGWTVLIAMAVVAATIFLMLLWFIGILNFPSPFQFGIRSLLILTVAVAIPCSWLGAWVNQYREHRRAFERIEDVVADLEGRYPDGVPPKHWDNALYWTWNALGNCLAVPDFMIDEKDPEKQFVRFADELEQRAKGRVGPETIDWIWDEIERLSKGGKYYSERWRPVHNGRLDERDGEKPVESFPFVSTAGSRIFHKRDCPLISKLSWREKNRWYETREAANGSGVSPCPTCNP